MALRKFKLGQLLEPSNEINTNGIYDLNHVKGISTQKHFIQTKADMEGVPLNRYKIVRPEQFAYVPDTSRRGDKISLAYNDSNEVILVSSISMVFSVKNKSDLLPMYLFMYFNRPEFDRFSRYNSWGSAREVFTWQEMCDIEIELPDLPTQEKFVNIYKAMVENQKAYERGLDDLKLVCDGFIEDLRKRLPCEEIGRYIKCTDKKTDSTALEIKGISNLQKFIDPNSRVEGVEKERYLKINSREFGYSPIHINDGSIALNSSNFSYLLSPIYKIFKILNEDILYPEYLMMWFARNEFSRYCSFYAFGSARDVFEWSQLCEFKIPIPSIDIQKSIANIYKCYLKRKEINEKLKQQIKNLCPILIKGSIEEAR